MKSVFSSAKIADGHLKKVCRLGKGANCCSYLIVAGRSGFCCAKPFSDLKHEIDIRREEKTITAMGDHCQGPPSFAGKS